MQGFVTVLAVALMLTWAVPALADTPGKININSADQDQLMLLDGIGESYAQRIIEYREQNGPFAVPEDLLKIKGIGPKTLELNKDRILVQDE
jgi:competence protein ComEA